MIEIKQFDSIAEVPDVWDSVIGDNLYLSKEFLSFMEGIDKCDQRYYMLFCDGVPDSVFMSYVRKKYNLAMFTRFNMYQKMTMIYVPLSVTRPGIAYGKHLDEVMDFIKTLKGSKMILNIEDVEPRGYAKGLTCPKCILTNRFESFDDYMNSLRSNYRYRYTKCFKKSAYLKLEYLTDNKEFTKEMYECYLQVYNKSKIRVEKLPIEFFRGKYFKIFVLKNDEKVVGFGQMLENGTELIFEFVGVDYRYNNQYDTYHRILLEIVRYGIENGFKTIDFGQTADESKLKLGSKYTMLYAYLHHSNKLINATNKRLAKHIEYRPITTDYRVFKEDG
ncbi:MAG: GNAT family N-acetyltransferase [Clostridia bacterium]|nr:GNAT family N-acetyltransferase [Clostridia bacterium]